MTVFSSNQEQEVHMFSKKKTLFTILASSAITFYSTIALTQAHKNKIILSELSKTTLSDTAWNKQLGESSELTFEIPTDAISFSVMIHSENSKNYFLIESLVDPKGFAFVTNHPTGDQVPTPLPQWIGAGQFYSPNRFLIDFNAGGYAGLLVPNNPKLNLTAGTWKLKIKSFDQNQQPVSTQPTIDILIKHFKEKKITQKTRGLLNINLQFTGSDKLNSDSYLSDIDFQNHLNFLRSVLNNLRIDLNFVGAQDINLSTQTVIAGEESGDQTYKLGKITDGVNLIFCGDIQFSGSNDRVDGLSSSILGPLTISNVFQNAVLISTKKADPLLRQAPKALIMAHEIFHYLGLPHTRNSSVQFGEDPFSDTLIANDYDYLMQEGLDHEAVEVTAQQQHLLLLSPAVTLYKTQ